MRSVQIKKYRFSANTLVVTAFCLGLFVAESRGQTQVAKSSIEPPRSARKVTIERSIAERHPLWPALELAANSYQHIRKNVRDYSCTVIRRERVDGQLQPHEYMQAKVRHRRSRNGEEVIPFSLYLRVLAPKKVKDREVLFVSGQNEGDMVVRNGGQRFAFVTTRINPASDMAMSGNRYPVTEFGFENLLLRLIEVAKEDIAANADTKVEFFNDAKIDGKSCTGVRVTHPSYDSRLRFHTATVFMDNETNIPVHYEAYDWPKEKDGEPVLLEQYTYRDIKVNQGLGELDFSVSNPSYRLQ